MPFKLQLVDWRDEHGASHPEYRSDRAEARCGDGHKIYNKKRDAEAAAEAAWIEQDCNGVAPVFVVSEC